MENYSDLPTHRIMTILHLKNLKSVHIKRVGNYRVKAALLLAASKQIKLTELIVIKNRTNCVIYKHKTCHLVSNSFFT